MEQQKIQSAIEAILFSVGDWVATEAIAEALEADHSSVREAAISLKNEYEAHGRGIAILELNDGFQMCSQKEQYEYIRKIVEPRRRQPLSPAALEVLSVIAYNQPVTKSQIEYVRGVDCTYSVNRLLERELIEEAGRLDAPGKPILYVTTTEFLRCFGLKSLEELPGLDELELTEISLEEHENME